MSKKYINQDVIFCKNLNFTIKNNSKSIIIMKSAMRGQSNCVFSHQRVVISIQKKLI